MSKQEPQIITVAIDKLAPNPWNPNKQSSFMFEREKSSIKEFGFIDPVTVREVIPGEYQIVDGEHRWRAAKELGHTEVPITNLGKISDARAKALTDLLNNLRGTTDDLAQHEMIQSILNEDESLRDVLPYTDTQLRQMLDFDWNLLAEDEKTAEKEKKERHHILVLEFDTQDDRDRVKAALERDQATLGLGSIGAVVRSLVDQSPFAPKAGSPSVKPPKAKGTRKKKD
jgi:ParB-like chromosome segregation protein Spo0J